MRGQHRNTLNRRQPSSQHPTAPLPAPHLIGVGVDGAPGGRDAVVLAAMLAQATRAELMLIAVYEEPLLEGVVPAELGWKSVKRQARAMLARTRDSLAPQARIAVQSNALAWRGLLRVARGEHRDLIVVGSGRTATDGQVRFGERARELLGHLECPLAIAPRGMQTRDQPRLRRIGVGLDDRPEARAALELAAAIAGAAGAELEVRGAVDDRVSDGLTTEHVVLAGDPIVTDRTRSLFDRAVAATRATGVSARVDVGPAVPADALFELAGHVDLLIIGSGRSGPAGRVFLGSTGRALVDGARCPVLVVPRPPDAAAI
jgi:nucleotide-binding universal stress UspA family protein